MLLAKSSTCYAAKFNFGTVCLSSWLITVLPTEFHINLLIEAWHIFRTSSQMSAYLLQINDAGVVEAGEWDTIQLLAWKSTKFAEQCLKFAEQCFSKQLQVLKFPQCNNWCLFFVSYRKSYQFSWLDNSRKYLWNNEDVWTTVNVCHLKFTQNTYFEQWSSGVTKSTVKIDAEPGRKWINNFIETRGRHTLQTAFSLALFCESVLNEIMNVWHMQIYYNS